jgi:hypothetical protein
MLLLPHVKFQHGIVLESLLAVNAQIAFVGRERKAIKSQTSKRKRKKEKKMDSKSKSILVHFTLKNVEELGNVHQIVRQSNIKAVDLEHVLEHCLSGKRGMSQRKRKK